MASYGSLPIKQRTVSHNALGLCDIAWCIGRKLTADDGRVIDCGLQDGTTLYLVGANRSPPRPLPSAEVVLTLDDNHRCSVCPSMEAVVAKVWLEMPRIEVREQRVQFHCLVTEGLKVFVGGVRMTLVPYEALRVVASGLVLSRGTAGIIRCCGNGARTGA